jgi:hypothetical protein
MNKLRLQSRRITPHAADRRLMQVVSRPHHKTRMNCTRNNLTRSDIDEAASV